MEILTIAIKDINLAVYNPRKDLQPGDPEYEKLKKSILEFDMVEPLVWNKQTGNLVGGHQRLKILQELGVEKVDVSVVDLSPVKEKALNIALNKIQGEWDFPRLKDLLQELDTGDFDIEITGFDDKEIEDLMTQFHVPAEGLTDDDEIPEQVETICKTGDLWQLGDHRLLCGDATKQEDVERLMQGEKADMVFTDPPYGIDLNTDYSEMIGFKGKIGNKFEKIIGDKAIYNPLHLFSFFPSVKEMILWGCDYYPENIPNRNEGSWFVWDKTGGGISPNSAYDKMYGSNFELCWSKAKHKRQVIPVLWKGLFGLYKEDTKKRIHPTQKPVELCGWFLTNFSKLNVIVADLFGGSGSTLIACEKLGRRCFMMEIDNFYCDVIIQRWQNFTGKQAEKLNGNSV